MPLKIASSVKFISLFLDFWTIDLETYAKIGPSYAVKFQTIGIESNSNDRTDAMKTLYKKLYELPITASILG